MDKTDATNVLELLPYGVQVAATGGDGTVSAIILTWLSQVSFDPPLIMVSLETGGDFLKQVEHVGVFSVNLLRREDKDLAQSVLRGKGVFPGGSPLFRTGPEGVPAVEGALGTLWCRVHKSIPAGDHTIILGEVMEGEQLQQGAMLTLEETGWKYRPSHHKGTRT